MQAWAHNDGAGCSSAAEERVTEELQLSDKQAGILIGAGGQRMKDIKAQTGANMHIEPIGPPLRRVAIWGTASAVAACVTAINAQIQNPDPRPENLRHSLTHQRRENAVGHETLNLEIPMAQVGIVIGRAGANIKELQARSGCDIFVQTTEKEVGDNPPTPGKRNVRIIGAPERVIAAREMVLALLGGGTAEGRKSLQEAGITSLMLPGKQLSTGESGTAVPTASEAIAAMWAVKANGTMSAEAGHLLARATFDKALAASTSQAKAAASSGPHYTEEVPISDDALATLLDPLVPGPLAQLQASGLTIHFARARTASQPAGDGSAPPSGKRPRVDGASSGDGVEAEGEAGGGTRLVRLTGQSRAVLQGARVVLSGCEASAAAAQAHRRQRSLTPDEALFEYYAPYYARVGLAYTPPMRLWEDDVDKEAQRFKMWASFYASGGAQQPQPQPQAAGAEGAGAGEAGGAPPAAPSDAVYV